MDVTPDRQVKEGEIVFCQVRPSQQYYAHVVLEKEWHYTHRAWRYWIGNLNKRVNGHSWIQDIYGKLAYIAQPRPDWELVA